MATTPRKTGTRKASAASDPDDHDGFGRRLAQAVKKLVTPLRDDLDSTKSDVGKLRKEVDDIKETPPLPASALEALTRGFEDELGK